MEDIIRIATRNSPLALIQAKKVEAILKQDAKIKVKPMTSSGDKVSDKMFKQRGGKGLFIKELEDSLLKKETDIAVHSLKDVPAEINNKFDIATISNRENPSDALVSEKYKSIYDLPKNAIIGTSSPRRTAMLKNISNEFRIINLRGNVQTRLKKMKEKKMDGIILAAAGLHRLSMQDKIKQYIETDDFVPSAGQGILCVEYLKTNKLIKKILKKYNTYVVERCAKEERDFIKQIGGDCMSPIGVYASIKNQKINVKAFVSSLDGQKHIMAAYECGTDENMDIGKHLAKIFISQGARKLLK
jgi:hydroxymethylbilane synthase